VNPTLRLTLPATLLFSTIHYAADRLLQRRISRHELR
jgi:hypothetical protein